MRALVLAVLLPVAAAAAEPPPAPPQAPPPLAVARGDLDGDGRPEEVRLERDGTVRAASADGRSLGHVALAAPAAELRDPTIDVLTVEKRPVAHVRARLGGAQSVEAVVLLDDRHTLHAIVNERTGPLGDGERAVKLRVNAIGLVRYQTSPGYQRCDGDELLYPEAWDWKKGQFRPVIDEPPSGAPLAAFGVAPKELADEPLGVFHFVAESNGAGADRRADRLASPVELEDHDPKTMWRAGATGLGRGAWVTARAEGPGHKLRALRIVPGPGEPPDLTLILDGGVRFSVELDRSEPRWIVLPEPVATRCVSIVIAAPPEDPASPGTQLAEVALYSELDGAGGVDALVTTVAEGKAGADAAARVLVSLGARAAGAIAAQLPTSHGVGHRRLIETLAQIAAPEAAAALGRSLETASADERKPIVDGLTRLGAGGAAEALRVYRDAGAPAEARADAAEVLGARAAALAGPADETNPALAALLAAAGQGPREMRAATIKAIARACAAQPNAARDALYQLARATDGPRLGDLARALGAGARRTPARAQAASGLSHALGVAPDFESKLRVTRALGDLGDGSAFAALDAAARPPNDDVERWAAVESAAALDENFGRSILNAALRDPDPRVRRAALSGLGAHPDEQTTGAQIAALSADAWPMVRVAAAEGLQTACGRAPSESAGAALARAVAGEPGADVSEDVRRASLAALSRCAPSSPAIAQALRSRRQPLGVRELAAALIGAHGGPGAAADVAAALDDVLADPAADERYVGLAVACLRALGRLHDSTRPILESLGAAAHEPLSAAVRAAAMEAIGRLCPEGAKAAFDSGANDADGAVRRAAAEARAKCKR